MSSSDVPPRRPPSPPTQPTQPLGAQPLQPRQPHAPPVVAEPVVERLPPELPPERWWDNPWPALLAGAVGLVAGALLGLALGDNGKTVTQTARGGQPAVTRTVGHTTTVVQPKVVVRTDTVTATTSAPTPAPSGAQEAERAGEAEANRRSVERENEELKRQLEER
jgi:hypothetical protein